MKATEEQHETRVRLSVEAVERLAAMPIEELTARLGMAAAEFYGSMLDQEDGSTVASMVMMSQAATMRRYHAPRVIAAMEALAERVADAMLPLHRKADGGETPADRDARLHPKPKAEA